MRLSCSTLSSIFHYTDHCTSQGGDGGHPKELAAAEKREGLYDRKIREATRVWWSRVTTLEPSRDLTELGWQHHGENGGKVRVLEQVPDFSLCCRSVRLSALIVAGAGPFRGYFGTEPRFLYVEVSFHPHKCIKRLLRTGLLYLCGKKG